MKISPVNQLSAGQQRRVALARLWLTRARLWILDEPFTAIDVNGVETTDSAYGAAYGAGGGGILTTHQPLEVETDKVRRIALTSEGQRNDVANLSFRTGEVAFAS